MNKEKFIRVAATIFLIIAVVHLWRVVSGWQVVVSGVGIPMWVSWAAIVVGGYLAISGFQLKK